MLSKHQKMGVIALTATLIASPALSCFICDDIVEFNSVTAQCFLSNVPDYLSEANTDKNGRVEVNLTTCSTNRSIDSFPRLASPAGDGESSVALIYTLEAESVTCLAAKLQGQDVVEVVTIDVEEECAIE